MAEFFDALMERLSQHQQSGSGTESVNLKIGTIYCDDHEPTNLQVVNGIWDYLQAHARGSILYMFYEGPGGLMRSSYEELDVSGDDYPFNQQLGGKRGRFETPEQFQKAEKTVRDLQLDGLVVIGGDDATINAYLLDEYFRSKEVKTCVIACPSTIQMDTIDPGLNCNQAPSCFGFDNVCEAYCDLIRNIMIDAQRRGKGYHFVRLTGHAASSITLECALLTCPNIAIIGDELSTKNLTLKDVRDHIVDVICKRSELGYNYGIILIPEGLFYFIPEVRKLFKEINIIFSSEDLIYVSDWTDKLTKQSLELFRFLPKKTRDLVIRGSHPLGCTTVPKIDTEWMLIEVVMTELETRKKKGLYKGDFKGSRHYTGCLQQDILYKCCYKLGYAAGELIRSGKTGLKSSIQNLAEPDEDWTVSWTPLTSVVDLKARNGKVKPVIKMPRVDLDGVTFKTFEAGRHIWAIEK